MTKIGFEIHRLNGLILRCRDNAPLKRTVDCMTGMHGWMIHYLYMHQAEEIYQKDLEQQFEIRKSTVSMILQTMEKNDLIHRSAVDHDARLKKITLTEKAVALHLQIEKEVTQFEEDMTADISDEELEAFLRTAGKLRQNLIRMDQNIITVNGGVKK